MGELEWYLGCAVQRRWEIGTIKIYQPVMVDTLLARFGVKHSLNIPASPVAELGPMADDDIVTDRPFKQGIGIVMGLAGMTRPDITDATWAMAHHSHKPCDRHWVVVEKILAYLNAAGYRHCM